MIISTVYRRHALVTSIYGADAWLYWPLADFTVRCDLRNRPPWTLLALSQMDQSQEFSRDRFQILSRDAEKTELGAVEVYDSDSPLHFTPGHVLSRPSKFDSVYGHRPCTTAYRLPRSTLHPIVLVRGCAMLGFLGSYRTEPNRTKSLSLIVGFVLLFRW